MPHTDSTREADRWLGAEELRRMADPQADPPLASEPEPGGRDMPVAGTALVLLALLVIALLIVF